MTAIEEAGLDVVRRRSGFHISASESRLEIGSHSIDLPPIKQWDNLRIRHALPYAARGDQREKLLFTVVQDAGPQTDTQRLLDEQLRAELEAHLVLPGARSLAIVADAMREEYWTEPSNRPFLLPYHADLPLAYTHSVLVKSAQGNARYERDGAGFNESRYRMFGGYILPFLCWTGTGVDTALIDDLLALVASDDGFTLLDALFLEAARALAPNAGAPSTQRLMDRSAANLEALEPQDGGAFCQPSMDRFQRDLRTVIAMPLPRADRIATVTQLVSLHLAIYYYRLALVLGMDLDSLGAAATGNAQRPASCPCDGLAACPLAGAIKVRAPSRGFRPISLSSPSRESYLALDRDRLLALPANIIAANLLERVWSALTGKPSHEGSPRPSLITRELDLDPTMRTTFDAAAGAIAVLYAARNGATDNSVLHIAHRAPGPFALQSSVAQIRRSRLKHTSRDVVNQLVYRPGEGSILRKNGNIYYYELDEDMLFLLVKLICGADTLPFDLFLERLAEYGLAPQDRAEHDLLAARLEELGMLNRYSDAGESNYVRHIF